MPRNVPPRLCRAGVHALGLSSALVVALAIPGLAVASSPQATSAASVPNCEHLSRVKIAQQLRVGSLEFLARIPAANACTYKTPHVADHFADLVTISVLATPEVVFLRARQHARNSPIPHQQTFGSSRSGGVQYFDVISGYSSQGLGPCRSPGATLPEFGPPLCEGQPGWYSTVVYSYGKLGRKGPNSFVSVGLASEPVTGSFALVTSLNKKIVSGKIH
jgi:hypothetical protein